jgi:DNA-directed RNA polymerase specialized sigma24 family protein
MAHGDETDAEALAAVLARDAEAFGRLFDRHAAQVHAFCARRSPDADDLLSMVFLEAWRCHDRAVVAGHRPHRRTDPRPFRAPLPGGPASLRGR